MKSHHIPFTVALVLLLLSIQGNVLASGSSPLNSVTSPLTSVTTDSLDSLVVQGNALRESGRYADAIQLYQQALDLAGDPDIQQPAAQRIEFQALNALAILNNEIGDQSRSLGYHKEAEAIALELNDPQLLMQNYTSQGALYRAIDSVGLAESYYQQAYNLAVEASDTSYQLMNQFNLANISTELGELERAAQQYEEVRAVSQELGNPDGQLYASLNLAIVYGRLNQLEASKTNYDRVAELLEKNDQALIRRRLYEGYASYYLKVGDTLRSEDYQLRYEALADEQLGTERQNRFLALQSDYEIRVKEQELALSELEAERLAIRNQLYSVIGGALFVALFAVYILQRKRIERLRSLYERNLEIVRSGADRTSTLLVDDLLDDLTRDVQGSTTTSASGTLAESQASTQSLEPAASPSSADSPVPHDNTRSQKLSVEEITKRDLYIAILKAFDDEELYRNAELNLDDLAHKFSTNRRYVSEAINQIGQTTFYALANTYRAKAARRKMIESDNRLLSLKTVMNDCGFKNMATFHKYFKALTGMTPGEFARVKK